MSDEVEETNSGVKKKGDWEEVAEFGEEVEEAMEDAVEQESLEKFEDWRPKKEEAENDMKEKTVDKALLDQKKMEKESRGTKKDLKEAGDKLAEAGKKAGKKKVPDQEIAEASEDALKPFYSGIASVFRKAERMIYSKIILRGKRYYLDTESFSADMKSTKDGGYEMDLNVPKEEQRDKLKQGLEEE